MTYEYRKSGKHFILFVNKMATPIILTEMEYRNLKLFREAKEAMRPWKEWVEFTKLKLQESKNGTNNPMCKVFR